MGYDEDTQRKLAELHNRRNLCRLFIGIIDKEEGDPRRPDALAHYQNQLAKIDGRIAEITGKPPDVVVGLKTAVIFPKAEALTDE